MRNKTTPLLSKGGEFCFISTNMQSAAGDVLLDESSTKKRAKEKNWIADF